MRAQPHPERRAFSRVLLAMAVLAVYFASHAALGSHGSQPLAGHGSTSSAHQIVTVHDSGDHSEGCHDNEHSPPHASHPQCVAMPRTADDSGFDVLASLIMVVAAPCLTRSAPRRRPIGGAVRSRGGRDVLRTLCVLRN